MSKVESNDNVTENETTARDVTVEEYSRAGGGETQVWYVDGVRTIVHLPRY